MIRKLFASLSARTPRQDQRGASAIEYVMIIAVIVIAIIVAFTQTGLGDWITGTFQALDAQLEGDAAPPGGGG